MARVLEVRRDELVRARVAQVEPLALAEGETRFTVERFGLTANNVSYALLGDRLRYWTAFPAVEAGWGRVPAWGFARATESRCVAVAADTRIFGYVPMGGDFVLTPEQVDERGLRDGTTRRAALPAVYAAYRRAEPSDSDDATMILQPLFGTSALLARSLENASRVILSSASSKTALGTAYLLARRGVDVSGITGSPNFAAGLGVYGQLVAYDGIQELEHGAATFVDLAGDARARAAVHRHLADNLEASVLVGATHLDPGALATEPLPGPTPTFFFAPDHVRDAADPEARAAFRELLRWSAGWLEIERRDGAAAVLDAWADAVAGRLPPTTALSLSLR